MEIYWVAVAKVNS